MSDIEKDGIIDDPLRKMLLDLHRDMTHTRAPGPTQLQRWRETLVRLDDAFAMIVGKGVSGVLEMSSGVSARTGEGFVHLVWGDQRGQLTPTEAREHARRIAEAAEAAEYDAIFVRWLLEDRVVDRIEQAVPLLIKFRRYRESGTSASLTTDQRIGEEDPAP